MAALRRRKNGDAHPEVLEIDVSELRGIFGAPGWLRDLGFSAWLLVGVTLFVVGAIWLLALTQTIVGPLIAAGVMAAVASPAVAWLERHRLPRAASAALLLLGIVVVGIVVVMVVVGGITSQSDDLAEQLSDAKQTIEGWAEDAGVSSDGASQAVSDASSSSTDAVDKLLHGLGAGISAISSLVFFLALTALSLFFLLKDGPEIRGWVEQHMGVPKAMARTITSRVLQSLRGYFLGVTIVAVYNAVLVGVGALILGVPLAGTIAMVTFLGAYVPYLGAWTAGAFAVLVSLGGAGTDAAIGMAVIQLLANGILQQLIQPIAMGAALGIHPLAVLIVTIGGGALFGAAGLILAAPLVSAATRISADLAKARAATAAPDAAEAAPA